MTDIDMLTENSWDAEREEAAWDRIEAARERGNITHPYAYMLGMTQAALANYVAMARPVLVKHAPAMVTELDQMVERVEAREKELLP